MGWTRFDKDYHFDFSQTQVDYKTTDLDFRLLSRQYLVVKLDGFIVNLCSVETKAVQRTDIHLLNWKTGPPVLGNQWFIQCAQ